MDKNLENKLDEMMQTIKVGFDEVHGKIDNIESKVATKEGLLELKEELLTEIQKTKLNSLDTFANKEKVNDHEIRITKLEEKLV